MLTIDAQIHIWDFDRPERPWNSEYARTRQDFLTAGSGPFTVERAIGAMDAAGIDAALITSFFLYPDISYDVDAAKAYPDRFRVVPQIDLNTEAPERLVAEYCEQTSCAAIRLSFSVEHSKEFYERLHAGEYDRLLKSAEKRALPVMVVVANRVHEAGLMAQKHPSIPIIIDHLGVPQGSTMEKSPGDPLAGLKDLEKLAGIPNIMIKMSGAPTLSASGYPYYDLWGRLRRLVDIFGPDRIMWGSDFSRTRTMQSYAEAVGFIRYADQLTTLEKELILGGSLHRVVAWPSP